MVEKWLLQVEQTMLQSMKNITNDAVASYSDNDRRDWILTWPGQVTIFFIWLSSSLIFILLDCTMCGLYTVDKRRHKSY